MISVILPVGGESSFYVEMCLANIAETCGLPMSDFDMVILTGSTISPRMQAGLDRAAKTYKFRVLAAPVSSGIHLEMLDWVVKQDIGEWFFPTHMDMFWQPNEIPWLASAINIIKQTPDAYAMCLSHDLAGSWFKLDGKTLHPAYDHIGAYKTKAIIDNNWSFLWGKLNQKVSVPIQSIINEKRLTWSKRTVSSFSQQGEVVKPDSWIDGSWALSLELNILHPDKIIVLNRTPGFHHVWCYIRNTNSIRRQPNIIKMDMYNSQFVTQSWRWAIHACVCSTYLDKDEFKDIILPYKSVAMIRNTTYLTHPVLDIFKRYATPSKNKLGCDSHFGVEAIQLNDKLLHCRKLM